MFNWYLKYLVSEEQVKCKTIRGSKREEKCEMVTCLRMDQDVESYLDWWFLIWKPCEPPHLSWSWTHIPLDTLGGSRGWKFVPLDTLGGKRCWRHVSCETLRGVRKLGRAHPAKTQTGDFSILHRPWEENSRLEPIGGVCWLKSTGRICGLEPAGEVCRLILWKTWKALWRPGTSQTLWWLGTRNTARWAAGLTWQGASWGKFWAAGF